jgi:cytochrome c5
MRRGVPLVAGILALLFATPEAARGQAPDTQLPPGEGREVVATLCTACHTLQQIQMKRDGLDGWRVTVDNMVMRGSTLFRPGEPELATQYLARNFGPASASGRMETGLLPPGAVVSPGTVKTSKEVALPEGAGKAIVEQRCGVMCHDLGRVVSTRRTSDEWDRIARNMSERVRMAAPQEMQTIVSYLTSHFGK